jgi:hypothetical protein
MNCTRSWLDHDRFSRSKFADRENPGGFDPKILRKPAIFRHSIGLQVKAHQVIAAEAVETITAGFVAVRDDTLAFIQAFDRAAQTNDLAGKLMPGDERKTWGEFAFVYM